MLALKNWKTTVGGLLLPALYLAHYFGVDVPGLVLPPLDQAWPIMLALFGIGAAAKDNNVAGV